MSMSVSQATAGLLAAPWDQAEKNDSNLANAAKQFYALSLQETQHGSKDHPTDRVVLDDVEATLALELGAEDPAARQGSLSAYVKLPGSGDGFQITVSADGHADLKRTPHGSAGPGQTTMPGADAVIAQYAALIGHTPSSDEITGFLAARVAGGKLPDAAGGAAGSVGPAPVLTATGAAGQVLATGTAAQLLGEWTQLLALNGEATPTLTMPSTDSSDGSGNPQLDNATQQSAFLLGLALQAGTATHALVGTYDQAVSTFEQIDQPMLAVAAHWAALAQYDASRGDQGRVTLDQTAEKLALAIAAEPEGSRGALSQKVHVDGHDTVVSMSQTTTDVTGGAQFHDLSSFDVGSLVEQVAGVVLNVVGFVFPVLAPLAVAWDAAQAGENFAQGNILGGVLSLGSAAGVGLTGLASVAGEVASGTATGALASAEAGAAGTVANVLGASSLTQLGAIGQGVLEGTALVGGAAGIAQGTANGDPLGVVAGALQAGAAVAGGLVTTGQVGAGAQNLVQNVAVGMGLGSAAASASDAFSRGDIQDGLLTGFAATAGEINREVNSSPAPQQPPAPHPPYTAAPAQPTQLAPVEPVYEEPLPPPDGTTAPPMPAATGQAGDTMGSDGLPIPVPPVPPPAPPPLAPATTGGDPPPALPTLDVTPPGAPITAPAGVASDDSSTTVNLGSVTAGGDPTANTPAPGTGGLPRIVLDDTGASGSSGTGATGTTPASNGQDNTGGNTAPGGGIAVAGGGTAVALGGAGSGALGGDGTVGPVLRGALATAGETLATAAPAVALPLALSGDTPQNPNAPQMASVDGRADLSATLSNGQVTVFKTQPVLGGLLQQVVGTTTLSEDLGSGVLGYANLTDAAGNVVGFVHDGSKISLVNGGIPALDGNTITPPSTATSAAPTTAPAGGLTGTQVNVHLNPSTILGGGAPAGDTATQGGMGSASNVSQSNSGDDDGGGKVSPPPFSPSGQTGSPTGPTEPAAPVVPATQEPLPPSQGSSSGQATKPTAPGGQVPDSITPRPDLPGLSGGRSGQNVPKLTGPPNSAIPGGGEDRIFITDENGNVVVDVTRNRAKPVIPGQGFGPKRAPTQQELDLLDKMGR